MNDPNCVVRIIAKDHGLQLAGQPGEFAQVGTISLNSEYFRSVETHHLGKLFNQQITLFDDVEDDEYDGDFGEDDEEMPMIRTQITIVNQVKKALPEPTAAVSRPVLKDIESNIEAPRLQTAKTTVNKRASPSAAMSSPMARAGGSFVKRKTVITATG